MPLDGSIIQAIRPRLTVPQGLVGHWPLSLADVNWSGGVAYDRSGQGYNGTLNSITSADLISGKIGQSLKFNGTNAYIDPSAFPDVPGDKTISLWVKSIGSSFHNTDTHAAFVSKWSNNQGLSFIFWEFSGNIYWGDADSTELAWTGGVAATADGNWHHLTAVRAGSTGYIYADARLKTSGGTFIDGSSSAHLLLGAYYDGATPAGAGRFYGYMNDVRFYKRALRAQEILSIYEAGRCGRA